MDIEALRRQVAEGRKPLRITTYAQIEAAKDGLFLSDLLVVFEKGRVLEEYETKARVLVAGFAESAGPPIHIVVEDAGEEGVIVTAYIPDRGLQRRRRKPRRRR